MKRAFLLIVALTTLGCQSDPLTEIVVAIDTDLRIPDEIDTVRVEVTGMQSASGVLAGEGSAALPRTVSLVHREGPLGPVTVRVIGSLDGDDRVERTVVTSFIAQRTLYLPVFLQRLCLGASCGGTETCLDGVCGAADVDPATLMDFGGSTPRFDGGTCVPETEICNDRDDDCDRSIDETFDFQSDTTNCGGCGLMCQRTNASASCVEGACRVAACDEGFANCDGEDGNGCEDDLSSATHCGACGNTCSFPNATAECSAGDCALAACLDGFADCNMDPADGCETPLDTLADCGACGVMCDFSNAAAACVDGACAIGECDAGFGDCNEDSTDGCELPLNTLTDCGSCGTPCSRSNATTSCDTGMCLVESCDELFDDCNSDPSDGCERPLNTVTDCGSCDTPCAPTEATGSCETGMCEVGSCTETYGDCNDDPSDGCEERLIRNDLHCGSCDNACVGATDRCNNTGMCV